MKTRGEGLPEPEIKRLILSSTPYTVLNQISKDLSVTWYLFNEKKLKD
jgi:hypothetical protein